MRRMAWWGWLLVPGAAAAQDRAGAPFTGVYAGPEVGLQEHGFTLTTTDPVTRTETSREYGRTGVAGGGLAGFDAAVGRRVRLGVEAGASVGGGAGGRADLPGNNRYEQRPRWGYRAVARAGYVLGGRTMVFVTAGYGAQRYRLRTSVFVDDMREWRRGAAAGVGVEHRVGGAASIRLDLRHVAGASNQIGVAVPIRF